MDKYEKTFKVNKYWRSVRHYIILAAVAGVSNRKKKHQKWMREKTQERERNVNALTRWPNR
jgi:hypothetical protein